MAATSPSASAAPPATATATAGDCPHPTYTEMITQALTELGGTSGRIAISAFILSRFTGLPDDHDKLLKANLRRLVSQGVIRGYGSESRSCYVFPASDTRGRGRPSKAKNKNLSGLDLDDSAATAAPLPEVIWPAQQLRRNSGCVSQPKQTENSDDPSLDGFQSNSSSAGGEDDVDDGEYTPHKRRRGRPSKIPRGRGRPRKDDQQSQSQANHPPTPTASTGEAAAAAERLRGRGRPRKGEQQSQSQAEHPPTPTPLSTGGIKRGRGRPRKEDQQSDPTKPAEAGDTTPAETGGSASAGIKRPRGGPRKEKPAAAAMSAQGGDAVSAGIKRGRGRPRKEKPPAEAASTGISLKRGRGRPRKYNPAGAAISAKDGDGDAVSTGIKRGRGRPRKYNPAGAAISTQDGDGDAVSTGMKVPLDNPIPRPSARDIVSMVMNRECGPAFETWFGDMAEASRRRQQERGGGRGENH